MPSQLVAQQRLQQVRMGSPGLVHPQQQMPGKQPPRMLLQQIQASRLNNINNLKPGQPQSPMHGGSQQRQQPVTASPQQLAKTGQQQLLQNPSQQPPPPPPPPYPGPPPPPYPGNNAPPQQGTEQVCYIFFNII